MVRVPWVLRRASGVGENDTGDSSRGEAQRDLRSYGRRRGRTPSRRQAELLHELLPQVRLRLDAPAPDDLAVLFGGGVREVWLEIGFGGGEHLVWQAKANPEVGLIGCEPFQDGVIKVLAAVQEHGLGNIRLHPDDAREALRWLPDGSLGRVFVLFPDPWPKARHHKRRLVSAPLLAEVVRVLRPGGELRLATDIADYARGMLRAVRAAGAFTRIADGGVRSSRQRPDDWPPTRYEAKALREGRKCIFLRFEKHAPAGN